MNDTKFYCAACLTEHDPATDLFPAQSWSTIYRYCRQCIEDGTAAFKHALTLIPTPEDEYAD
jgi:hypothetical protein